MKLQTTNNLICLKLRDSYYGILICAGDVVIVHTECLTRATLYSQQEVERIVTLLKIKGKPVEPVPYNQEVAVYRARINKLTKFDGYDRSKAISRIRKKRKAN